MHQLNVPGTTCGHCVGTITKALKSEDPNARIEISLAEHLVKVECKLSREDLAHRIAEAGYTANPVAGA